jgi:hypothetical protein
MNDKFIFLRERIRGLLSIVNELENHFDGRRKFTLDGRLVGDIGEIMAELHYEIELDSKSRHHYDAKADDKELQIKATMKDTLTFRNSNGYYLGIKIHPDGSFEEIYNGPAFLIYERYSHRKYVGEKLISLKNSELAELSKKVSEVDKIRKR